MYKVIENGMEKMCSAKETEAMIKDFNITSENSPRLRRRWDKSARLENMVKDGQILFLSVFF